MIRQKLAVNEAGLGVICEQFANSAEGRKVTATHVSNNDETNECLLLRMHDGREDMTMRMQRSFNGKLWRMTLVRDMKATKAGLTMKDKMSKNILDKMVVARWWEIKAGSDEDEDKGCCFGKRRKIFIGKIFSISTYKGTILNGWNPFFFWISFSQHLIQNWKWIIKMLEQILWRVKRNTTTCSVWSQ